MKKYVGIEIFKAKEMTLGEYNEYRGWILPENENPNKEGYLVEYSDDYESWISKEILEKVCIQISENNTITQKNVDDFIKEIKVSTIGEKTTMVVATLINGFEIIETSSCVDKKNYNEQLGAEICLGRIKNKIWELLGFVLQTGINGLE